MATIGSAKATLVNKIDSLTSTATAKDTIFLAKALKENSSLNNFVWQGAWAATTAYATDDVVSNGGSTYMCIVAHTSGASFSVGSDWSIMAEKGTDGTDLTSTLTTQGDILYRDGSGLQRLSAGTSGQALLTQGTGANPIWGSAGGIKQVITGESSIAFHQNSPSNSTKYFPSSNKISATITPSSTSSKILVQAISTCQLGDGSGDGSVGIVIKESISGGSTTNIVGHNTGHYVSGLYFSANIASNFRVRLVEFALRSPNTTSAITYEVGIIGYNVSSAIELNNENSTGRIIVQEVTV